MQSKGFSAVMAALLLTSCGVTGNESGESTWEAGPQPTSNQDQQDSVSNDNSQKQTENKGSETASSTGKHPAAEPAMQSTGQANCNHMHPGGKIPRITNAKYDEVIRPTFKELCYRSFHLGHSGRTRTALWSAEVLDPQKMELASKIERDSEFKPETRLPKAERSELTDYRGSGFDRGHLAPSADMPSKESQQESFILSNIVPQNGRMNGGVWRELEIEVRKRAKRGKVYLVTGPIFRGSNAALKQRVLIPTSLYKAMYVVNKGAVVFVVTNDSNANTTTLSIDQFTKIYGMDPFPGLTGSVRTHNLALGPMPEPKEQESENGSTNKAGGITRSTRKTSGKPCEELQHKSGVWMEKSKFYETYDRYENPIANRRC